MNKLRNFVMIGLLAAVAVPGLYGCGGSEPTATPLPPTATTAPPTDTPAPPAAAPDTPTTMAAGSSATGSGGTTGGATGALTGPAADLLTKSQASMKSVKSFHYTMNIEASGGGQKFNGEGDFIM